MVKCLFYVPVSVFYLATRDRIDRNLDPVVNSFIEGMNSGLSELLSVRLLFLEMIVPLQITSLPVLARARLKRLEED